MRSRFIISLVMLAACFDTPQLQIQVTRTNTANNLAISIADESGANPSVGMAVDPMGEVFGANTTTQKLVTVFVGKVAPVRVEVLPFNTGSGAQQVCYRVALQSGQTLQRALTLDDYNPTTEGVAWSCPGGAPCEAQMACPQ